MKHTIIAAVVLLLATTTLAFGQPPGGPRPGERMRDRQAHLREALKLTDKQEADIKKLHLELQRKQIQLRSKIQLARIDLREYYSADKPDRSGIEKTIKQVSDLQQQMKLNFVDFWFAVNDKLTPEQQKTWKQEVGRMVGQAGERTRQGMRRPGMMNGRGMMRHGGMMMDNPDDDDGQ
jgi:Spy/CpxP family protein refolding chaperone